MIDLERSAAFGDSTPYGQIAGDCLVLPTSNNLEVRGKSRTNVMKAQKVRIGRIEII